jgi:transcription elongation factor Elf1
MAGADSGHRRMSQYSMQIECPECQKKMILQIGLTGEVKNLPLKCPGCGAEFVPLVPGPVVGGPFQLNG